jgi:hypothetical protein
MPLVFGAILASALEPIYRPALGSLTFGPFWVVSISLCSLAFYLFFGLALKRFDSLERGYSVPLIQITAGDTRRLTEFNERIDKYERKMNFWVRTVFIGFVISLLASLAILLFS